MYLLGVETCAWRRVFKAESVMLAPLLVVGRVYCSRSAQCSVRSLGSLSFICTVPSKGRRVPFTAPHSPLILAAGADNTDSEGGAIMT